MIPTRPRYARAEKLAEQVLATADIAVAPVPIEDIVKLQGIDLHFPNLGPDISGVLIRKPDATIIGVNRTHSKNRQRFSIAHELGHVLLHKGEQVHYDAAFRINLRSGLSSQGTDVEEMEANTFAACVLMPRAFLEEDPEAFVELEDPVAVSLLAKRYGVSAHAMSLRLANLLSRSMR